MSQAELASLLGVTQQAVGKWESGKSSPDPTTVAKLAEILDTTADYLLGLFDPTAEGQTEERFFGSYVYSLIPVIGTVKAGYGALAYEEDYGKEYACVKDPENYFFLVVKGDSMEPRIHDGDPDVLPSHDATLAAPEPTEAVALPEVTEETKEAAEEPAEETDRRIILDKISHLKEELKSIDRQKSIQRKNRGKLVRVALVGYTNVGKSTLMNLLSKSEVFAENKLFATLDTTVRKVIVDNLPFLLSDTVGFIRKLPTHLVDSFKSTLDEVREADLLLHIVDISHPAFEEQIEVVNKTLQEVCDSTDKPMILVFNKIDAFSYVEKAADDLTPKTRENITLDEWKETWMGKMHDNCIFISAKEKKNIDELKTLLYQRVKEIHTTRFPYNDFLFQHYDEITTDEES